MNIFQLTIRTNACKNSIPSEPKSPFLKFPIKFSKSEMCLIWSLKWKGREQLSMLNISGVEAVGPRSILAPDANQRWFIPNLVLLLLTGYSSPEYYIRFLFKTFLIKSFENYIRIKHNCSSQPSMVHWLSSPLFPCLSLSCHGDIPTSTCPRPPNPYIFWKLMIIAIQRWIGYTNTKTKTNTKTMTNTKMRRE